MARRVLLILILFLWSISVNPQWDFNNLWGYNSPIHYQERIIEQPESLDSEEEPEEAEIVTWESEEEETTTTICDYYSDGSNDIYCYDL